MCLRHHCCQHAPSSPSLFNARALRANHPHPSTHRLGLPCRYTPGPQLLTLHVRLCRHCIQVYTSRPACLHTQANTGSSRLCSAPACKHLFDQQQRPLVQVPDAQEERPHCLHIQLVPLQYQNESHHRPTHLVQRESCPPPQRLPQCLQLGTSEHHLQGATSRPTHWYPAASDHTGVYLRCEH
jgi:hypothetical protein